MGSERALDRRNFDLEPGLVAKILDDTTGVANRAGVAPEQDANRILMSTEEHVSQIHRKLARPCLSRRSATAGQDLPQRNVSHACHGLGQHEHVVVAT